MTIEYYVLDLNGNIVERSIDTANLKYVSHDDDTVTISESWENEYAEVFYDNNKYHRKFENMRKERIATYKKAVAEMQKLLSVHENCVDYKDYWRLMYNKD